MSDEFNTAAFLLTEECRLLVKWSDDRARWEKHQNVWRENMKQCALDAIAAAKKFIDVKNREDS